ncbi:g11055 [Coccomyxa elongata]
MTAIAIGNHSAHGMQEFWNVWRRRDNGPGRVGLANGVFPVGCKWRDVQREGTDKEFWAVEEYEFWDDVKQTWTSKQQPGCIVEGHACLGWATEREGSPRSEVNCTVTHCIYENLWYNNGRFYLLVDGPHPVTGWKMTRNQDLNVLHVDNATAFVDNLKWRVVSNDTLLFDFVYFLHPTAIGHWGEMMFPLFSILKREPHFQWPPAQFLLLHLKRVHLLEWARAVIATTLGVLPSRALPPLMMQQEADSVWDQILSPLEGFGPREWVCFERALVVRDMFLGGERTFLSQEDARAFRSMIYAQYGLPPPTKRPVPRVITFQRKRANRRVINEEQLVMLLQEFGQVNVVEFNASTPFEEQLRTMAATGVFVSVHTSNLANAPFLQPGSAVIEIIQRNWIWDNLDKSFQIQTEKMGDIHHFAWRARSRNQTIYINKRDGERFGDWESLQCSTEDCVEAHTNVDVVVNLDEFRALLESRLPLVFGGASVEEAALPWPPIK